MVAPDDDGVPCNLGGSPGTPYTRSSGRHASFADAVRSYASNLRSLATNSMGLNGLTMYSAAPSSNPRMMSASC